MTVRELRHLLSNMNEHKEVVVAMDKVVGYHRIHRGYYVLEDMKINEKVRQISYLVLEKYL